MKRVLKLLVPFAMLWLPFLLMSGHDPKWWMVPTIVTWLTLMGVAVAWAMGDL